MIAEYCKCVAYFNDAVEVLNSITAEIEVRHDALADAVAAASGLQDSVKLCERRQRNAIALVELAQLDLAHAKQAALCMYYARTLIQARAVIP